MDPLGEVIRAMRLSGTVFLEAEFSRNGAEVAVEAGYDSEAAFSRGFKSEFGVAPSEYRRRREASVRGPR